MSQPRRVLISGPPASGKSTLARRIAARINGSLIDFDLIAREMGSPHHHDHPAPVRRKVMREIERRLESLTGPAVVIRSAPKRNDREALALRIRADEVVVLEVPPEQAKRQAENDGRAAWTFDAIDRWWQLYEPSPLDSPRRGGEPEGAAMAAPETTQEAAMADDQTTDAPAKDAPEDKPDDTLGEPGKKALEAERAARREAERKLREIEDRDKTELQKLQDALKERDTQLTSLPKQARKEAIRFASQATKAGFFDAEDALLNIDVDDLSDSAAVKAALEELAERKPHLVRKDPAPKVPKRPKPPTGQSDDSQEDSLKGKERAAAALRQFRNT